MATECQVCAGHQGAQRSSPGAGDRRERTEKRGFSAVPWNEWLYLGVIKRRRFNISEIGKLRVVVVCVLDVESYTISTVV